MRMPFGTEQFFEVFRRYNEAVWPAQLLLYLLAAVALVSAWGGASERGSRRASTALAALWFWMGLVYHIGFFRAINPAALAFGAVFILQAGLFLWYGVRRNALVFRRPAGVRGAAALVLVCYALVIYPALGAALGHRYPESPTFGLPCPTTIFTLALLLSVERHAPWPVFLIPLAWSAVGAIAAVQLGVPEDYGLAGAGVLTLAVLVSGLRMRHGDPVSATRA